MRSTSALLKDGLERFVIGKAEEFMELTAEDSSVDLLFGEEGARRRCLLGRRGEGQADPEINNKSSRLLSPRKVLWLLSSCQGEGGERDIILGGKRTVFRGKCVARDARYRPEASASRPGIGYGHEG